MKNITMSFLALALAFSSCQKVEDIAPKTTTEFSGAYATEIGAGRDNSFRKSNLKVIIKQVGNVPNQYRMVLKVDSVIMDIDGTPYFVDVPAEAKVTAGLSLQDPKNLDVFKVIFDKSQMNFRREQENGTIVYNSDPFMVEDFRFTMKVARISFGITTNFAVLLGKPLDVNETETHLILESGKTIVQNPELEKLAFNVKGNGTINAQLGLSGDPLEAVTTVVFTPAPYKSSDPNVAPVQAAKMIFTKTMTNKNNGVSIWKGAQHCIGSTDSNKESWNCNSGDPQPGTLYLLNSNGSVISSHYIDDWQGESNF